jgi:hypothetical protein
MLLYHFMKRCYSLEDGAGGGANPPATDPAANPANPTDDPSKAKPTSLTQEQIDALVDKAYAKAYAKAEKDSQKKLDEIKKQQEAEALKNAPDAEKLKAFEAKANAEAKARQAAEFKLGLASKGLPAEYADILTSEDEDRVDKAVDFLASYKAATEKPLLEKITQLTTDLNNANLRSPAPQALDKRDSVVNQEQFNKMGYKERIELKTKNPSLYETLTKK